MVGMVACQKYVLDEVYSKDLLLTSGSTPYIS